MPPSSTRPRPHDQPGSTLRHLHCSSDWISPACSIAIEDTYSFALEGRSCLAPNRRGRRETTIEAPPNGRKLDIVGELLGYLIICRYLRALLPGQSLVDAAVHAGLILGFARIAYAISESVLTRSWPLQ